MELSQALPEHYNNTKGKDPVTLVRPNDELLTKVSPKHSLITKTSSSPHSSPKRPSASPPPVRIAIDSSDEEEEEEKVLAVKGDFKIMAAIDPGKVYWMFHIMARDGGEGFALLFDPSSVARPAQVAARLVHNKDRVWCDISELAANPLFKSCLLNVQKAEITGDWTAYPDVHRLSFDDPKRPVIRTSCHITINTSLF
jgi:hypothetical protein